MNMNEDIPYCDIYHAWLDLKKVANNLNSLRPSDVYMRQ